MIDRSAAEGNSSSKRVIWSKSSTWLSITLEVDGVGATSRDGKGAPWCRG